MNARFDAQGQAKGKKTVLLLLLLSSALKGIDFAHPWTSVFYTVSLDQSYYDHYGWLTVNNAIRSEVAVQLL